MGGPLDEEALLEAALEGDADSYELIALEEDIPGAEVFAAVNNLEHLNQTLKEQDYRVQQAELRWIASNTIEIDDPDRARSLLRLMDSLEDLDDVQSVTSNFEMTDALMVAIAT